MIGSLPQTLHSLEPQKLEKMDPMLNQVCRVCDEPAAGFHFGAFTCEGCKSFFGRTCNNQSVIQECKNSYRCVVDKKNRTACKACRLRKCLMVGMSKSGSRYGRRSNWFKIHCLMQNQSPTSSHEPPSKTPYKSWPPKSEGSVGENRDSSFGSSSRSPSPLNTSLESLRKASPSSHAESPFSPSLNSSPDMDLHHSPPFPPSPLSSLYSSPLSNPLLGAFSPFYKLSPLLASNPLLAPHLLLQLQGQRSHLDALTEQRQLLDKFRLQQHFTSLGLPMGVEAMEQEDDRPVSPPHSTDAPIDLSVKISTAPILLLPPSPTPSVSPRIEVSTPDKSDANQNLLGSSALDLTVSS